MGQFQLLLALSISAHSFSLSNSTLEFVAAPALAPAEVAIDSELMKAYEVELQKVS